MISAANLGADFQTDLLRMMQPLINTGIVSKDKVVSVYSSVVATIRAEAEKGAREGVNKEIPTIETRVKKTVTPFVVGSLAASGVALAVGIAALISARKKG